ncbi:MAG: hemerythrin family protein [Ruminococcus sp.]|jgi:hemerythrin|nr:hemerythrin family protein [Ruminococcus sp.]
MYAWREEWATGNGTIDGEHKQLFKAIDDLLAACKSGTAKDQVAKTMAFLKDYTAKHFAHEEQLQQQSKYPDYINHKKLHDGFQKYVAELSQRLYKEGPTIAIVGAVNMNVGDWLVKHITREDKKLAQHIKNSKQ